MSEINHCSGANSKVIKWSALFMIISGLIACGGGGGGSQSPQSFTVTGTKGPLSGSNVSGSGLTCTRSNNAGLSTCTINPGALGPFVVSFTDGFYCTNEAQVGTGCTTVNFGGTLRTVSFNGTAVRATPFTEAALQNAGDNPANFAPAYTALANLLGIPTNPTSDPFANSQATALLVSFSNALANGVTLTQALDRIEQGRDPQTNQPVVSNPGNLPTGSTSGNAEGQSCPAEVTGGSGSTGSFFDSSEGRVETCTIRSAG